MNKKRRQRLQEIWGKIGDLIADVEYIMNEEQDALDNLPESLQDGEKGQQLQENVDKLDEIKTHLDNAYGELLDFSE
jgi:exonuclease VII large subunit